MLLGKPYLFLAPSCDMVTIDDPTVLEVKEEMADFADEVDGAEFKTGESKTGNDEYLVEMDNSFMKLVKENDDGIIKLQAEGDTEVRTVSDLSFIEFDYNTERVVIDMIDFGL